MSDAEVVDKGTKLGAKTLLGGLFMTFFVPSMIYMFVAVVELKESNAILAHELPELTQTMREFKGELNAITSHMTEHEKLIPKHEAWKAGVEFELEYLLRQCSEYDIEIEQCKDAVRNGF